MINPTKKQALSLGNADQTPPLLHCTGSAPSTLRYPGSWASATVPAASLMPSTEGPHHETLQGWATQSSRVLTSGDEAGAGLPANVLVYIGFRASYVRMCTWVFETDSQQYMVLSKVKHCVMNQTNADLPFAEAHPIGDVCLW